MATLSTKEGLQKRTWKKDNFLISTDSTLIPISTLIDVFNSETFYWAKALPVEQMREMLANSLCFGLYEDIEDPTSTTNTASTLKFIGIARCVTDFVTFAYVTDVWVDPTYQGKGLGSWLIGCLHEVFEAMPSLRRSLLFTGDWKRSVPFYEKLLGMKLLESKHGVGLAMMECKGKGHPSYGREGAGY